MNFEFLVNKAIEGLPDKIKAKMDNVVICIQENPTEFQKNKLGTRKNHILLGLYEGIPKNTWGRGFGNNLPDKITIFQNSITNLAKNNDELENLIGEVVWHEIAHHFGFEEKNAEKLGKKFDTR